MQLVEETMKRRQLAKAGASATGFVKREINHFLVDKNLFLSWCQRIGVPTPKTVKVKRGGTLPGFHFHFPVLVKEAAGHQQSLCRTKAEVKLRAEQWKGGYQVQEHLLGFTFYRLCAARKELAIWKQVEADGVVTYVAGADEEVLFRLRGATRRLREMLASLGVNDYTLTVAVRQETIYIVSCRPEAWSPV